MTKYRTVQIPNDLVEEIKREIKLDKKHGYRSHSEFIIDAARHRLEELRRLRTSNPSIN